MSTCGFNAPVELWAEGIPDGAIGYFDEYGVPPFETIFNLEFDDSVKEGTYDVKIFAGYGQEVSSASVEIVVTNTPYILLGTTIANPEDVVTLEGHGFAADSFFDVFFDGKPLKTGKTDSVGVISTEIEIPSDTPDGRHTVLVKDTTNGGVSAPTTASATLITPLGNPEEAEECAYELPLSAGWNMVSFPCLPEDASFSNILGGIGFYQVLTWDGTSYITPSTAEASVGYWVLVLEDTSVCLLTLWEGNPVESYELDLPAGWSMIGSILPCIVDADCVFPSFYQLLTWDGTSYVTSAVIEPGKGYWALVLEPTHITVDDSCCLPS